MRTSMTIFVLCLGVLAVGCDAGAKRITDGGAPDGGDPDGGIVDGGADGIDIDAALNEDTKTAALAARCPLLHALHGGTPLADQCQTDEDCPEYEWCVLSAGTKICSAHPLFSVPEGSDPDDYTEYASCTSTAECDTAAGERCLVWSSYEDGAYAGCSVDNGCRSDDDCSPEPDFPFAYCLPAGNACSVGTLHKGTCGAAQCRSDADCAEGPCIALWSYSEMSSVFPRYPKLVCAGPGSECLSDKDCWLNTNYKKDFCRLASDHSHTVCLTYDQWADPSNPDANW